MNNLLRKLSLRIQKSWYQPLNILTFCLLPFSFIFYVITSLRRWLYHHGFKKIYTFDIPIIVVGNINVGGTGKTPLVIYLANMLEEEGYHVGIVSRGYTAKNLISPKFVTSESDVQEVGDEPLLIARHVKSPLVIFPDRVKAVEALLQRHRCDVVISDDGLQHYALGRNIEIVVVDGARQFGNQQLLPAGPLRESVKRLTTVDFVVSNGTSSLPDAIQMSLIPGPITSVSDLTKRTDVTKLRAKIIHAVAGIGYPQRFFNTLKNLKLCFFDHVFPDHYQYKKADFEFGEDNIIIMTEKDAVKCRVFADERFWFVPVEAKVDDDLKDSLLTLLSSFSESGELEQKRGVSYED